MPQISTKIPLVSPKMLPVFAEFAHVHAVRFTILLKLFEIRLDRLGVTSLAVRLKLLPQFREFLPILADLLEILANRLSVLLHLLPVLLDILETLGDVLSAR